MAHDGGKDGIANRISCRQLAALLEERPSFVIGKVERKAREAVLRPQEISDWRNASSGQSGTRRVAAHPTRSLALARDRNPPQVRAASLPTTGRPLVSHPPGSVTERRFLHRRRTGAGTLMLSSKHTTRRPSHSPGPRKRSASGGSKIGVSLNSDASY